MPLEKPGLIARIWSNVIVILGFVAGAYVLLLLLLIFGSFGYDRPTEAKDFIELTTIGAHLAVVLTAIGAFSEYIRRRRKARQDLPHLLTLQANIAAVNGRAAAIETHLGLPSVDYSGQEATPPEEA